MLKHDSLEFKWLVQHYFVLSTCPFPPTAIKIHHAPLHVQQQCIKFSPAEVSNLQTQLYTTWDPCTIKKKKRCIFFHHLSLMLDDVKLWLVDAGMQPWGTIAASEWFLNVKRNLLEHSQPFWVLKKTPLSWCCWSHGTVHHGTHP